MNLIDVWVMHLVGDFLLQNSYMAQNKQKDYAVLLFHVIVATFPMLFLVKTWGDLGQIVTILLLHLYIDGSKTAKRWNAFYGQDQLPWIIFVVDQVMHLLSIWVILRVL